MEGESGQFADLIRIVEKMAKKTSIEDDLGGTLDNFLARLHESQAYLQHGIFKTNFAEAAIFIQSAAVAYGKKVDLLWDLIANYHTRVLSNDNKATEKEKQMAQERINRFKRRKKKLELKPQKVIDYKKLTKFIKEIKTSKVEFPKRGEDFLADLDDISPIWAEAVEDLAKQPPPVKIDSWPHYSVSLTQAVKLDSCETIDLGDSIYLDDEEDLTFMTELDVCDHVSKFLDVWNRYNNLTRKKQYMYLQPPMAMLEEYAAYRKVPLEELRRRPKFIKGYLQFERRYLQARVKQGADQYNLEKLRDVMPWRNLKLLDEGSDENSQEDSNVRLSQDSGIADLGTSNFGDGSQLDDPQLDSSRCDDTHFDNSQLCNSRLDDSQLCDSRRDDSQLDSSQLDNSQIQTSNPQLSDSEMADTSRSVCQACKGICSCNPPELPDGSGATGLFDPTSCLSPTSDFHELQSTVQAEDLEHLGNLLEEANRLREAADNMKKRLLSSRDSGYCEDFCCDAIFEDASDDEVPNPPKSPAVQKKEKIKKARKKRKLERTENDKVPRKVIKLRKTTTTTYKKFESFFCRNYTAEDGEGVVPDPEEESEAGEEIGGVDEPSDELGDLGDGGNPLQDASFNETGLIFDEDIEGDDDELLMNSQIIAATKKVTEQFIQASERQRKYIEWKQFVDSQLRSNNATKDFDIHGYGTEILASFPESGNLNFDTVVAGKSPADVTRYFVASLQLANTYNVELIHPKEAVLANGAINMKLLSKDRYHEHLVDYQAPSEETFLEKLSRVKTSTPKSHPPPVSLNNEPSTSRGFAPTYKNKPSTSGNRSKFRNLTLPSKSHTSKPRPSSRVYEAPSGSHGKKSCRQALTFEDRSLISMGNFSDARVIITRLSADDFQLLPRPNVKIHSIRIKSSTLPGVGDKIETPPSRKMGSSTSDSFPVLSKRQRISSIDST